MKQYAILFALACTLASAKPSNAEGFFNFGVNLSAGHGGRYVGPSGFGSSLFAPSFGSFGFVDSFGPSFVSGQFAPTTLFTTQQGKIVELPAGSTPPAATPPSTVDTALTARVDKIGTDLKTLTERVDSLTKRVDELFAMEAARQEAAAKAKFLAEVKAEIRAEAVAAAQGVANVLRSERATQNAALVKVFEALLKAPPDVPGGLKALEDLKKP